MKVYRCKCGKEFKSYCGHCGRCSIHLGYTPPIFLNRSSTTKGRRWVNKDGLRKLVSSESLDEYISNGWNVGTGLHESYPRRALTLEEEMTRRMKISSTMKKNPKAGGRRIGSGRGKKGWYKGIFCDSSWELAVLIYCLDHGISIERCTEKRPYEYDGKIHYYHPDFIIDGKIYEVKGAKTKQWEAKISQNPDVIVIDDSNIAPYLDYCTDTYGNYLDLYEVKCWKDRPRRNPKEILDKKSPESKVWIHDGSSNKLVKVKDAYEYLDNGYVLGFIRNKQPH